MGSLGGVNPLDSSFSEFQSFQGPADPSLQHSLTEGYQVVSRIGEVVSNAFVDGFEFTQLPNEGLKGGDLDGSAAAGEVVEPKPHFHEWATVLPGMICLARKARTATFRGYVAAETAVPVVGCAAGLKADDAANFCFAGICRSKTVRPIDDGNGPSVDEYFTIALGGLVTMINNSAEPIFPGDVLEWNLFSEKRATVRAKAGPRRVGIAVAAPTSERVIGMCKTFAKPGGYFDLQIKGC